MIKIKKRWLILTLIFILPVTILLGHRYLTKAVFEHWCENNTGLFVYEKVALGDEYFVLDLKDKDIENISKSYIFENNLVLNKEKFEQEYKYQYFENEKIYSIGPIYKRTSTVTRRSDSKVLARAVSVIAYVSLFKAIGSNKRERTRCPTGSDNKGYSNYGKYHKLLLQQVINIK